MYFPYDQFPYHYMVLTVRTHTEPGSVLDSIRRAVDSVDPDEPVYQARTLDELIDESLVPWRFSMTLLSVFVAMALLLAAAASTASWRISWSSARTKSACAWPLAPGREMCCAS